MSRFIDQFTDMINMVILRQSMKCQLQKPVYVRAVDVLGKVGVQLTIRIDGLYEVRGDTLQSFMVMYRVRAMYEFPSRCTVSFNVGPPERQAVEPVQVCEHWTNWVGVQ